MKHKNKSINSKLFHWQCAQKIMHKAIIKFVTFVIKVLIMRGDESRWCYMNITWIPRRTRESTRVMRHLNTERRVGFHSCVTFITVKHPLRILDVPLRKCEGVEFVKFDTIVTCGHNCPINYYLKPLVSKISLMKQAFLTLTLNGKSTLVGY